MLLSKPIFLTQFLLTSVLATPLAVSNDIDVNIGTNLTSTTLTVTRDVFERACRQAVDYFPTDPPGKQLPTTFRFNPYNPTYDVPVYRTFRDICFIQVGLKDGVQSELSSWIDVKYEMNLMIDRAYQRDIRLVRGFAGENGNIEVWINQPIPPPPPPPPRPRTTTSAIRLREPTSVFVASPFQTTDPAAGPVPQGETS